MSVPTAPAGDEAGALQARYAATLVDEWVRGGLRDAVVCPGSRSSPLALALAAHRALRVHVRLDERGAGFFALGLALGTGRPSLVLTTSGTAAAELHPAVVEAHHAAVPVLVCTADRPPELQGVGAPQTIDQHRLYGTAVRWFAEPGVADPAAAATWRPLAARALAEARDGPAGPGPVHLNLAFREPLWTVATGTEPGAPDGGPVLRVHVARPSGPALADAVPAGFWARRGVVVAGAGCGDPEAVLCLAARLRWPLVADPRSGCRRRHGTVDAVVGAADALLRDRDVAAALRPEAVLMLGRPPVSKAWAGFVADAARAADPAVVVAVGPHFSWADPDRVVHTVVVADPAAWAEAVAVSLEDRGHRPVGDGWAAAWTAAEAAAQAALDGVLGGPDAPATEPAVARAVLGSLPPGTAVVVSSSMPVRDLEWYAPCLDDPPPVFANRGANGIDGVCSTALGVAAGGTGPVVAVVGDLAFLHDLSALVRPAGVPQGTSPCTLVVLDNGGGGIFSFLPQAAAVDGERFEQLFGTPQATAVADAARGLGVPVAEVSTVGELVGVLGAGPAAPVSVVRVAVPDRAENAALHDEVHAAVAASARRALGL